MTNQGEISVSNISNVNIEGLNPRYFVYIVLFILLLHLESVEILESTFNFEVFSEIRIFQRNNLPKTPVPWISIFSFLG